MTVWLGVGEVNIKQEYLLQVNMKYINTNEYKYKTEYIQIYKKYKAEVSAHTGTVAHTSFVHSAHLRAGTTSSINASTANNNNRPEPNTKSLGTKTSSVFKSH